MVTLPNNATDKVCERGTKELRDYYKTGDFSKIGLDDKEITCKEKDKDYMKALKKIVKKYVSGGDNKRNLEENNEGEIPANQPTANSNSDKKEEEEDGEITESIIEYGKHILPLIIFLVIGILCIPGWLICCFCCCCNCCCCCCCTKPGCKIPCFIFTYIFYALAVVVCVYGLSQSNQIFEGMADTECSFLRFVDELLDGETKETLPKWAGIEGIIDMLDRIKAKLENLKGTRINTIKTHINDLLDNSDTASDKNIFLNKIKNADEDFKTSGNYYPNYYKTFSLPDKCPGAEYLLDLIVLFGKYDPATDKGTPEESVVGGWVIEFQEVSKVAEDKLRDTRDDFTDILDTNFNDITKIFDDSKKIVTDFKSNFQGIQDEAAQSIIDYSEIIDEYGKLGFKLVFTVLGLMNIALAIFVFFICFFSGKMCTNCCCCRCIFKFATHLLWNVLALLMIITFIIGFLFTFIGQVGSDVMSLLSYVVSEDNFGEGKENLLIDQLEEAKDYLFTCVNGNGDIMSKLGVDLDSSLESFDQIKEAENLLNSYISQFDDIKSHKMVYNEAINYLTDITEDLETENDFGFILQNADNLLQDGSCNFPPAYLKFKEILTKINDDTTTKGKDEKWENSCTENSNCDSHFSCYRPITCLPHQREWLYTTTNTDYSSYSEDLKYNVKIVKEIKDSIDFAKGDTAGSYKKVLDDLAGLYDKYLDSYKGVLVEVKGVIKELTDIIKKYTGENGGVFSFVNCKFIGKNLKVILKYLGNALGTKVYTVGVCLFIVGCALALSISSTILLIVVINASIDKNKLELNQNQIPEYKLNNGGRVIQYQ